MKGVGFSSLGKDWQLKDDFFLVHAQRYDQTPAPGSVAPPGIDSFLVLNSKGAQIQYPTYEYSQLGTDNGPHRLRDYWISVTPPDETGTVECGYFIDEQNSKYDSSGWCGQHGWSKESDAQFDRHKKDTVASVSFQDAVKLLAPRVISKVNTEQAYLSNGRTKEDLNFRLKPGPYSTGNSFRLRPTSGVDNQRASYELKRIELSLDLIKSCGETGNYSIKSAGERMKSVLEEIKKIIADIQAGDSDEAIVERVQGVHNKDTHDKILKTIDKTFKTIEKRSQHTNETD